MAILATTFPFARTILDLCGGTGAWSEPYRQAGYDVRLVTLPDDDVRLYVPKGPVWGVLAAPPCTEFSSSGARWWTEKGDSALLDALGIVDACLRIVYATRPRWWVLENPVGRLSRFLGPPVFSFDPCDFGDPWTKRTLLWGDFVLPAKSPVEPTNIGRIHRMPPSEDRGKLRSITPPGFARAFFEANP